MRRGEPAARERGRTKKGQENDNKEKLDERRARGAKIQRVRVALSSIKPSYTRTGALRDTAMRAAKDRTATTGYECPSTWSVHGAVMAGAAVERWAAA